ncbi:MAG TPA: GTPase [Micromonosporaceae bacterium]|nr:GTPase [Micromonosporaceae bacterium]
MTSTPEVRTEPTGDPPIDVDRLLARVEAVKRFLTAVETHLPADRLIAARTAVERAGARLALSRDHTVVALAGATGSGKSSLFNALAYFEMSPVGVRRPTTGATHACIWGPPQNATRLLDWLGVLPRYRFVRESALDGDDEAPLRGLVLLDLPDLDSVQESHRFEADRMLGLIDMVVWVLDPQKYADRLVHASYLRRFHQHKGVTVVVLNQADLLASADVPRVLDDLRRLLAADQLEGVPVLATSALRQATMANLRVTLEKAVRVRQAALRRLSTDIDAIIEELSALMGPPPPATDVDRETEDRLTQTLATVAGVPAIADAVESEYRRQAADAAGSPLIHGLRRLRPDPFHRLRSSDRGRDHPKAARHQSPTLPSSDPATAQRSVVNWAARTVTDRSGTALPEPWQAAIDLAARPRLDGLPAALDRAVKALDLELSHQPSWWRLVAALQWLATIVVATGTGWLLIGYLVRALGMPALVYPMVGPLPAPTLLLLGGVLFALLVSVLVRPVTAVAARRVREQAETRLRTAVAAVGRDRVMEPVRNVFNAYRQAWEALAPLRERTPPVPRQRTK